MRQYTAGETAKEIGINIETLRYYERIKIMPKPKRKNSGYRLYDEFDLKRLMFIKRAKEIGFTLKEIKELLNLKIESTATCGDVKHLAQQKLANVRERINDLKKIEKILIKLIDQCNTEEVSTDDCPILEVIEQEE